MAFLIECSLDGDYIGLTRVAIDPPAIDARMSFRKNEPVI